MLKKRDELRPILGPALQAVLGRRPAPVRPSIPRIRTAQKGTTKQIDVGGEPKVRIHFPPPASLGRTRFFTNLWRSSHEGGGQGRDQVDTAVVPLFRRQCRPPS